jgi:PAS domain-containing protein
MAMLREKEAFRILFQDNPAPAWIWDARDRRFLEANDAALALYGWGGTR